MVLLNDAKDCISFFGILLVVELDFLMRKFGVKIMALFHWRNGSIPSCLQFRNRSFMFYMFFIYIFRERGPALLLQ